MQYVPTLALTEIQALINETIEGVKKANEMFDRIQMHEAELRRQGNLVGLMPLKRFNLQYNPRRKAVEIDFINKDAAIEFFRDSNFDHSIFVDPIEGDCIVMIPA